MEIRAILKFIGVLVAGLIIYNAFDTPTRNKGIKIERISDIEPAVFVTAEEIAEAYDANSVAADKRFKCKKLNVTGTIANIGTGITGNPYITLKGGVNQFLEPHFSFNKSALNKILK